MAEVLLSTLADALGGPVVADATFTATATRARAVGDGVVANKTITVPVVQGVPSEPILLDQSGVDWCWRLRVVFPSIGVRIDRTVAVPDVPSVEWADLVDVDPATLLPAESAVPAWTAAVGQVAAILADTAVARDGAATAQGLSEAARDAAVLARGISEIARDGAVVAQGASEAARGTSVAASVTATTKAAEASTDAAAAEAAKLAAQAVPTTNDTVMAAVAADTGSAFSTQLSATMGAYLDVNVPVEVSGALASDPVVVAGVEAAIDTALPPAITTVLPGAVTTEVTTQVTPHVTAAAGSATAAQTAQTGAEAARDLALAGQFAGADLGTSDLNTITTPGVYRQGTTANATLVLNYPVASVQGVLEVFHSTATSSIFQRYMQTTGTASSKGHWQRRYTSSAWSAWGFVATQRVDQTAGRAIYTWDYANNREQMIYGDTGWLDISTLLLNGWGGMVRMRRTGADVQLAAQNVTLGSGTTALTIPIGFRAQGGFPVFGRAATGNTPIAGSLNTGTLAFPTNVAFHGFSFQTAFSTGDTWPSSLPGTAEGSIPA